MAPVTIYQYGPIAWIWRILLGFIMFGALGSLVMGAIAGSAVLLIGGGVLLAPSIFLGTVVAVAIVHVDDEFLDVTTLLFRRRLVRRSLLGMPRLRTRYEDESATLYAPRIWVPVRGQWPVYIDLLGEIPDRSRFSTVFGVHHLPNAR